MKIESFLCEKILIFANNKFVSNFVFTSIIIAPNHKSQILKNSLVVNRKSCTRCAIGLFHLHWRLAHGFGRMHVRWK